jgi:hypothetical protein
VNVTWTWTLTWMWTRCKIHPNTWTRVSNAHCSVLNARIYRRICGFGHVFLCIVPNPRCFSQREREREREVRLESPQHGCGCGYGYGYFTLILQTRMDSGVMHQLLNLWEWNSCYGRKQQWLILQSAMSWFRSWTYWFVVVKIYFMTQNPGSAVWLHGWVFDLRTEEEQLELEASRKKGSALPLLLAWLSVLTWSARLPHCIRSISNSPATWSMWNSDAADLCALFHVFSHALYVDTFTSTSLEQCIVCILQVLFVKAPVLSVQGACLTMVTIVLNLRNIQVQAWVYLPCYNKEREDLAPNYGDHCTT